MSVYDPTVGSGGMLIQARDYLRECGADAAELSLNGQEKMGTTWSICKMNMLLHGISHADIRNADTLADPQHKDENNELRRFDRVLANPPFSQNYAKTKSKDDGSGAKKKEPIAYPGRFHVWMPEKGKKADLMFVQHMLAVLKSNGRMATVMPHGVLFRGGEEREARQYFIDRGYLEAVIGLPSNLFYGTGIPACILVLNKDGAQQRDHVLFINADREYREDILQSQFPEVLAELEHQHARLAELQALFAAASEEDFEDNDDTGVLPADEVKALKASLKEAKGMMKLAKRDSAFGDWNSYRADAEHIEQQLARHKALEDEAKTLKAAIKSTEAKKDELVEQARLKISKDEARHQCRAFTISGGAAGCHPALCHVT